MSSKIAKKGFITAAWRISLWSGAAFAVGTAIAFWFLQSFLANDIQHRADSWLTGELGVLADVTERSPDAILREVAELASREVPHVGGEAAGAMNRAVFFVQAHANGNFVLHTGAGTGPDDLAAIQRANITPNGPGDVMLPGFSVPFRVAAMQVRNGDRIYLALSTSYEQKVLLRLRLEFAGLWCGIIALGTLIVFVSTRRMLHRVQVISETASGIGRSNLTSRVPASGKNDEITVLSSTFNQMLDRIEASVQQLHTMSDSLAHDLRSPLTSLRGKLELALMSEQPSVREDTIISSIEQLDRLSTFFTTSLDVSEANADALRLKKESVDLEKIIRAMVELYEPSFTQAGLGLELRGEGPAWVQADSALLQRTLANLFDNELKHVRPGSKITVTVQRDSDSNQVVVEDNGSGFPDELLPHVFEKYVKGTKSDGHGLGLAFVAAVIRSHDGNVIARNHAGGGAAIVIDLPCDG